MIHLFLTSRITLIGSLIIKPAFVSEQVGSFVNFQGSTLCVEHLSWPHDKVSKSRYTNDSYPATSEKHVITGCVMA